MMVTKNEWNEWAKITAKRHPYLAGAILMREVQTGEDYIILQFDKNEPMLKKIALTYVDTIKKELKELSGRNIRVKIGVTGE